jgi:hypothetical protein
MANFLCWFSKKFGSARSAQFQQIESRLEQASKATQPPEYLVNNIRKRLLNQIESERFAQKISPERTFYSVFSRFQKVAASLVLLAMTATIGLTFFLLSPEPSYAEVGKLSVETGQVKIRQAEGSFYQPIDKEAIVRVGDNIRVEKDSLALLSLRDASKIKLAEETELEIKSFQVNEAELRQSDVKVTLLSGSVETVVQKNENAALQIQTASGTVEAQNAKFSVTINPETGKTEVATTEDQVDVTSVNNPESQSLVAGQTATIGEATDTVAVTDSPAVAAVEPALPNLESIKLKIDLAQIRSFDALIAAQRGELESAKKVQELVRNELQQLATELGAGEIEANETTALRLLLQQFFTEGVERQICLADLNKIEYIEEILSYYYISPNLLHGIPEFELLPKNYKPKPALRSLYAALKVYQLARIEEVRPFADKLLNILVTDSASIISSGDVLLLTEKLLTDIDQPIYLAVLRTLLVQTPEEGRALLEKKIAELEDQVQAYIGGR